MGTVYRNAARTFDIGEHAGEKFLTMEYVEGESLGALLAQRGALHIAEAVALASEICGGSRRPTRRASCLAISNRTTF